MKSVLRVRLRSLDPTRSVHPDQTLTVPGKYKMEYSRMSEIRPKDDRPYKILNSDGNVCSSFKNDQPENIQPSFQLTLRGREEYKYHYDVEKASNPGSLESLVLDFWRNHPMAEVTGFENYNQKGDAHIEVIIESEKSAIDADVLLEKLMVANQINNMEKPEMYDLTYFLGHDPRGKSRVELLLYLIGNALDGKAMIATSYVDGQKLLTAAVHYNQDAVEKEIITVCRKGVFMNIIERSTATNMYLFNGNELGSTLENVYEFCRTNMERYKSIRREVAQKDVVDPELEEIKSLKGIQHKHNQDGLKKKTGRPAKEEVETA